MNSEFLPRITPSAPAHITRAERYHFASGPAPAAHPTATATARGRMIGLAVQEVLDIILEIRIVPPKTSIKRIFIVLLNVHVKTRQAI